MTQFPAKPRGLGPQHSEMFRDACVAQAYRSRPPHPEQTIELLADLVPSGCSTVLDLGCGTGFLARPLSRLVERVDAIDFSAAMISTAKQLPDGSRDNINWICAAAEDAPLHPPYGLIVAGDSLHWMNWHVVLPRCAQALVREGYLAVALVQEEPVPWGETLNRLIPQYSTNREFERYDLIQELKSRGLFQVVGRHRTRTVPWVQSAREYIESMHARNGFSRQRMDPAAAREFDQKFTTLLREHGVKERVELHIFGEIVWGKP